MKDFSGATLANQEFQPSHVSPYAWLGRVCFVVLIAWLSGCTSVSGFVRNGFKVGPNFQTPPASVAPRWIDAADMRVRSETDDLSQWWKVFDDPVLDDLICHAYRQNLTLREAGFRVMEARAEYGVVVGGFFPQSQTISGGYNRNATSIAQLLGGSFGSFASGSPGGAPNIRRFFNQNTMNFGLAWELDFWGRFRRAIEASSADLDASVDNYDDVLVTLLGDVAANYVQFRVLEKQIEYLNENANVQRKTLKITKARFDAGAKDSEIDYPQGKTTLAQTLAQIPPTEARLRIRTNRICVLLGIPPEELQQRLKKATIPNAPKQVASGIPADLLRRRPDVRRAERIAAAESARIGVAQAQLYPHISINGTFGWQAPLLKQMFTPPAFQGNYGPSIQWDVLNYGRNLNKIRFQKARFEAVVTTYQNKVLIAAEEVENGLIAFTKSQEQVQHLIESVREAKKARDVLANQLVAGKIDFNRLAVLELSLVQQQNLLAQAQGDVALGLVQVYRALGGGWQIREKGCEPSGAFRPGSAASDVESPTSANNGGLVESQPAALNRVRFGAPLAAPPARN
ncbi:MAG: efflux transporter outer membrane subunit [Planctomycetes bacterium]|nr:efflux transporter outer membrane subunit [Planctomycetota bacterium]